MTIESPSHRLRLVLLSLSLFCSGVAVAQSTETKQQPPGVSVLECRWEKRTSNGMMSYRDITTPVGQVNEGAINGQAQPDKLPRFPDSGGRTAYLYALRIKNEGSRAIRSMAFDYVFDDPASQTELGRRSLQSFEKVDLNKTKLIELKPNPLGPPKIATVEGMRKDRRSPFDEHIEIKCVLYTDGTGWKAPDAEAKTCDELVRLTLHPDARRR